MRDVTDSAEPPVDIWPYVDSLDRDALGVPGVGDVTHVYRDAHERFDQVLIATARATTSLVIVVDRQRRAILGHHLLDLGEAYGIAGESI